MGEIIGKEVFVSSMLHDATWHRGWAPVTTEEGAHVSLIGRPPLGLQRSLTQPLWVPFSEERISSASQAGVRFPPQVMAQLPLLWRSDNLPSLQVQRSGGGACAGSDRRKWILTRHLQVFKRQVFLLAWCFIRIYNLPIMRKSKEVIWWGFIFVFLWVALWNIYEFSDNIRPGFLCSSFFPSRALQRCRLIPVDGECARCSLLRLTP